jgi:hypothetical protein
MEKNTTKYFDYGYFFFPLLRLAFGGLIISSVCNSFKLPFFAGCAGFGFGLTVQVRFGRFPHVIGVTGSSSVLISPPPSLLLPPPPSPSLSLPSPPPPSSSLRPLDTLEPLSTTVTPPSSVASPSFSSPFRPSTTSTSFSYIRNIDTTLHYIYKCNDNTTITHQ